MLFKKKKKRKILIAKFKCSFRKIRFFSLSIKKIRKLNPKFIVMQGENEGAN